MQQVQSSNNSALDRNNLSAEDNVSNDHRNEQPRGDICRIGIKTPVFSKRDPDLYFIQMESQFRNAGITTDQTKYDYVVGNLDSATLRNIADIVRAPPAAEKYEAVKNRLIQDFADSENRKLRRLVQECQLGDCKPTHLLRTMRDLASGAMNDGAIKQLWLDRLPEAVRAVVSISEADLDKCAQQADLMLEMGNYNSVAVISSSTQNNDLIMKAIDDLSKQVVEIKTAQRQGRTRSQTPDRKRCHPFRTVSQVRRYSMCHYHHRFGAEAKKCSSPCSFNQQGN